MKGIAKKDYTKSISKIFRKIIMKITQLGLWELLKELLF